MWKFGSIAKVCGVDVDRRRQESVGQRKRIRQRVRLRHAIGQRRLLRHLIGQRLVDRSVVVNPVAGAHHRGTLCRTAATQNRCAAETRGNSDAPANRDSRPGWPKCSIGHTRTTGIRSGAHRRFGSEVRPDVQVHQAVVQFGDGRLEIPAHPDIETEVALACANRRSRIHPPRMRGNICRALPKAMELVAGQPTRKSAKVIPFGEGAGETKAAARILLRQLIEVEPAEIAAKSEVVLAMHPDQVLANLVGVVVIQRKVAVRKARDPA